MSKQIENQLTIPHFAVGLYLADLAKLLAPVLVQSPPAAHTCMAKSHYLSLQNNDQYLPPNSSTHSSPPLNLRPFCCV